MGRNHCLGVASDLVRSDALGRAEWKLRGRVVGPPPGHTTRFGTPHTLTFQRDFFEQLDRWARSMDHWTRSHPSAAGPKAIAWFGEVGTIACHRPTAAHNRARGIDLCQIRFTDGDLVDMNASPAGSLRHQRRYLAVAANLRRYFGTVLTVHYNAAHRDHIHVDDLTAVAPIRTDKRTDTTLVQSAANLLDGAGLAIDGAWGSRTEAAYLRLVRAFSLECTDPRASVEHAQLFLSYVVMTGAADAAAATYRSGVCEPCDAPSTLIEGVGCEVDAVLTRR